MDIDSTIDLGRQALTVTMYLSAPILAVGMVVGLIIGLLQALTQIQDQTIAFVPKLLAMVVAMGLAMPWILNLLLDYARVLFGEPPIGVGIG